MKKATRFLLLAGFLCGVLLPSSGRAQKEVRKPVLAATPPMGWNSWDSFSRTLDESSIRATARWMAGNLKSYGWDYVVVDEGWYLGNLDSAGNDEHVLFELDSYGRYVPVPARFPSAGKDRDFRPLADYLHSLGLKFGIHIIRGIPRQAVEHNLPIAGTKFHAAEAADTSDVCPWNPYNYGLDPRKPAAQAYYDSLAKLYASWRVDFIKIDCISDHPYKGEEIRMFRRALGKSGRPMVLSLSPGPTAVEKREEVMNYSEMWRISDDTWDVWYSDKNFPNGLKNQFAYAARWAGTARPGAWPDADMLPLGSLRPAAGWGEPRDSRLTHDEQRTLMTLWSVMRSPLIMGGNLLEADPWTVGLLTNREVLDVDQHSTDNHPVVSTETVVVWTAKAHSGDKAGRDSYVAVFNISDAPREVRYAWKDVGLDAARCHRRDLWERRDLGAAEELRVTLAPHASALYRVSPQ